MKTYQQIRKEQFSSLLKQAEIPESHYTSLPLPTLQMHQPGYVSFAAPRLRNTDPANPGKLVAIDYDAIDRWWILSADKGTLIQYTVVIPTSWHRETINVLPMATDVKSMVEATDIVDKQLSEVAPAFFKNEFTGMDRKVAIMNLLKQLIPLPLMPDYERVAPDFFAWLQQ